MLIRVNKYYSVVIYKKIKIGDNFMEEYICKLATIEEMEENWNYLIKIHPNDNAWKVYKEKAIKDFLDGNSIVYYGILNGRIISEATAMISNLDVINTEGLIDDKTIYLSAFRTVKEYQTKGFFSKLYRFMENDLEKRGYTRLILGVEPNEVKNIMIYFKYGFTNYIKSSYEEEPAKNENEAPRKVLINYYSKDLKNKENKNKENNEKFEYKIVPISKKYREKVNNILIDEWEATNIIIRGKIIDGTKLDGFLALKNDEIVGVVTYMIENNECEICSLNSLIENKGIGTSLINKIKEIAKENNCTRLKLVTTNDNIRGLEFYQRRGFVIANIYKNAMENSRKLKPQIPMLADNGLPIRDEIELEIIL